MSLRSTRMAASPAFRCSFSAPAKTGVIVLITPRQTHRLSGAEVLGAFLSQFYDDKPCPSMILLSEVVEDQELLGVALTAKSERKVTILVPQRGEKTRSGRACA